MIAMYLIIKYLTLLGDRVPGHQKPVIPGTTIINSETIASLRNKKEECPANSPSCSLLPTGVI